MIDEPDLLGRETIQVWHFHLRDEIVWQWLEVTVFMGLVKLGIGGYELPNRHKDQVFDLQKLTVEHKVECCFERVLFAVQLLILIRDKQPAVAVAADMQIAPAPIFV